MGAHSVADLSSNVSTYYGRIFRRGTTFERRLLRFSQSCRTLCWCPATWARPTFYAELRSRYRSWGLSQSHESGSECHVQQQATQTCRSGEIYGWLVPRGRWGLVSGLLPCERNTELKMVVHLISCSGMNHWNRSICIDCLF